MIIPETSDCRRSSRHAACVNKRWLRHVAEPWRIRHAPHSCRQCGPGMKCIQDFITLTGFSLELGEVLVAGSGFCFQSQTSLYLEAEQWGTAECLCTGSQCLSVAYSLAYVSCECICVCVHVRPCVCGHGQTGQAQPQDWKTEWAYRGSILSHTLVLWPRPGLIWFPWSDAASSSDILQQTLSLQQS